MSRNPSLSVAAIALLAGAAWLVVESEGHASEPGVGTVSDPQQNDHTPGPPPPWRWRLTLPGSGIGKILGAGESGGSPGHTNGLPLLLATLSRELASANPSQTWILEGGLGWIVDERDLLRFVLRAGAGPSFRLLDSRRAGGRGSTLAVQAEAGLSYWGQSYDWLSSGLRFVGPTLLGGMIQLGIEAVRFTSARSGWCIRLRGVSEGPFLHVGSGQYYFDEGTVIDNVRGNLAMYLDLGRAW